MQKQLKMIFRLSMVKLDEKNHHQRWQDTKIQFATQLDMDLKNLNALIPVKHFVQKKEEARGEGAHFLNQEQN